MRSLLQRSANDYVYNAILYNYHRLKKGYFPRVPDIRRPTSFNEKILHLKMYCRLPNASMLADKYRVRSFVEDRVGRQFLIPLYAVYDDPEKFDLSTLPDSFVIKPNHASGMVKFCSKAEGVTHEELVRIMCRWMSIDYGRIGHEYQYRDIERKILIEKDMRHEASSGQLSDYKLFCFNGEPRFIQVDFDRFDNHSRNFYDTDWRRLPFGLLYRTCEREVPRPSGLDEMMEIARQLSRDMPFARIDLYDIGGRVYFGEITLHPDGGVGPFDPDDYDKIIGSYLELPFSTQSC